MKISGEFIPDGMNSFERNVKRVGDCIIASILMMLFSPLFLVCYIAVKREDGGPVIFKQERIGRFGRPFYIYKFRSMRLDAEKKGPALFCFIPYISPATFISRHTSPNSCIIVFSDSLL